MLERAPNFFTARHHAMHVPRTMFAAAIDGFGGPEVITPHALPVPAVDAGEILIAVDTAGVGRWDADIREGYYAARKPHRSRLRRRRHRGCRRPRFAPEGVDAILA